MVMQRRQNVMYFVSSVDVARLKNG